MFEHSRKAILLGLGALELTREKVDSLVDELIKRGEVAAKERSALVEEFLKTAEEEEKKVLEKINTALRSAVTELGLATKEDLQTIERRLERIERGLAGEQTKDASE